MQSPVDIKTAKVHEDPKLLLQKLHWNYVENKCKTLTNTGKGWKVIADDNDSYLTGGPLENIYRLLQIHGHWGICPASGSEHTVDGTAYAGELHLVHWNAEMYPTPNMATEFPRGLAVIAVFLKEGNQNAELTKVTDMLAEVSKCNQDLTLLKGITPAALFPDNTDYWTYEGSLTTPDFNESVTWIIFKNPIEVSHQQLEAFRSMKRPIDAAGFAEKVDDNRRIIQDLNGRIIRASPVSNIL